MKVELNVSPDGELWPRCFYDSNKRCGEPETRGAGGPTDVEIVRRSWHVADMCECPSCPLRCAIRDALNSYKEKV